MVGATGPKYLGIYVYKTHSNSNTVFQWRLQDLEKGLMLELSNCVYR